MIASQDTTIVFLNNAIDNLKSNNEYKKITMTFYVKKMHI